MITTRLGYVPHDAIDPDELDAILDGASPNRPGDSIPSATPLGNGLTESNPAPFTLVKLRDLGPPEPVDWLWPGFIPRAGVVLLSAHAKAGKTTLLSHLLRDLYRGGGLAGDASIDDPTILLSEEHSDLWRRRASDLGIDDEQVMLCQREARYKPDTMEWRLIVDHLGQQVKQRGVALVVIDTLSAFLPVDDENDSAQASKALAPLRAISDAGAALLLVHHARKSGGQEMTGARGSSAFLSFPDILIELKRANPDDHHDRRRVLTACGRYADIPPESVIELRDDGYHLIGDRVETTELDRDSTILHLLPLHNAAGLTAEDLRANWPENSVAPGLTTFRGILNYGFSHGKWDRFGSGVRGDPFRFRMLPPECDSVSHFSRGSIDGIESET